MEPASLQLWICLNNSGYEAALERRKIYIALEDPAAQHEGLVRVVDESGQDYLYPRERFIPADLPSATRDAVIHAA